MELIVAGGRANDRRVFGAILRRITALQYVPDRGVGRGEQLVRQEVTEWVEVTRRRRSADVEQQVVRFLGSESA